MPRKYPAKASSSEILCSISLGRVDGFRQDDSTGEGDECCVVLESFFATQCDSFEPFELPDKLLNPCTCSVKGFGKELGLFFDVGSIGYDRANTPFSGSRPIGSGVVALVGDDGTRRDVRTDFEQGFELSAIAGLASGQLKGEMSAF